MSPGIKICEAGTSLDWDGDTKVFLVLILQMLCTH